jgi:uncharacterized protein YidB (DUF937 family)
MTITWRGPLLVASLVAVLAVAGCGGDDNDSSSTGTAAASTQAAATTEGSGGASTAGDSGGSGGDDEFCTKLKNIGENLQDQSNLSDPQQLGKFAEQVEDALKSANPPEELQDEWSTLTDLFDTLATVMNKVDLSDPSSLADVQDDLQEFQSKTKELSSATTALSQYAADHCGGAFS